MPDTNDRVMAMIEKELQANPDISNEDLRTKAEKLDDAVGRMSARQFNATYPLQVKRRLQPRRRGGRKAAKGARAGAKKRGRPAGAGRKRGRGRPAKGAARGRAAAVAGGATIGGTRGRAGRNAGTDGARGRVRAALLDFARDLASADGAGLVDVIAGVDGYVDRVMKATGTR